MKNLSHRSLTVIAGLPVLVALVGSGSGAGISYLGKTADRELVVGQPVVATVVVGEAAPDYRNLALTFRCATVCRVVVDFEDPALASKLPSKRAEPSARSTDRWPHEWLTSGGALG